MNQHLLLLVFFQLTLAGTGFSERYYVLQDHHCNNCDGLSWETAFHDLQDALALASDGDEIWVSAGTYLPHTNDRNIYFDIPSGVSLYGGFIGEENSLEDRDWQANLTYLSGDLQGNDTDNYTNYWDNSYTIVFTDGVNDQTIVDGFIIKGGNADASSGSILQRTGAGWFNKHYQGTGNPQIRNCTFEYNRTTGGGGAFYNTGYQGESKPTFEHCIFRFNQANTGGVIYNEANQNQCKLRFIACLFEQNEAEYTGGVIYNFAKAGSLAEAIFGSCIFSKNEAANAGALYGLGDGGTVDMTVTNCTFYANYAGVGGVIYLNESWTGEVTTRVNNSIIWNSQGSFDRHFHFSGNGEAQLYLSYSLIDAEDCSSINTSASLLCNNLILDEDPQLMDAENGDFHAIPNSLIIDAGSKDEGLITSIQLEEDFEGTMRQLGDRVDMGAYEYPETDQIDLELTLSTNNTAPIIGSAIVFTLELNNQGPSDANSIAVGFPLPDGYSFISADAAYDVTTHTWTIPSLAANTSQVLQLSAKVLAQGEHNVSAEVTACSSPDIDSSPANGEEDDYAFLQIHPIAADFPIAESFDELNVGVLSPNPTQNELFIKGFTGEEANYIIFSANGQPISRGNLSKESSIAVHQLDAGLYFLVVNQQIIGRFLKID